MSAFDDILVGAKQCFDFAAEKVNDGIEVSRVKFEKTKIKAELSDCYEKLGRLYYREAVNDAADTAHKEKLVEKIGSLQRALAEMDEKAPSKFKLCPSCAAKNPTDAVYCQKCGEKF